ncbi:2-isopropylmalate synthase (plasmid) [Buchnera aphidicola (Chaitoregma tattakana)]|uniref:2-isopropylmalate synthase n=1 Tax=Buchnera aphidicola TaxID=9 RepID=UPI0031B8023C
MKEKIIIFDTTLRDGEQSLSNSLTCKEKLKIAILLENMGVDIIEAGFPISSPEDFQSVKLISQTIKNSKICSLARCLYKDIDIAAKAMKYCLQDSFRIHLFIGTSNLHIKHKLKKNFDDILDMSIKSVIRARKYTNDIEFSCEDAGRTEIENLCIIIENVIKNGATTINIPDTVGYTVPLEFSKIVKEILNKVPNIDKAILSVHCHNDLGMATGNAITAIQCGARQIEGTIGGIGERAGNTALEEVIMTIKTRKDILNFYTNINFKDIYKTSKKISNICNLEISSNKPIIGSNAFSHSSGIHQDGVLKNKKNYEIISPESIGSKKKNFNLTSRSGRAAIKFYMKDMGYSEKTYDLNILYKKFIKLADQNGRVFKYDLEALAFLKNSYEENKYYELVYLKICTLYNSGNKIIIKLKCGNKVKKESVSNTSNLIFTIFDLIKRISKIEMKLKKIILKSKTNRSRIVNLVNLSVIYNNTNFHSKKITSDYMKSYILSLIIVLNSIRKYKIVRKKLHNV